MKILLEIKIPVNLELKDTFKKLNIPLNVSYKILKKSVDARFKIPHFFYRLLMDLNDDLAKELIEKGYAKPYEEKEIFLEIKKSKPEKVLVVGSGPSGLFCAYILALAGKHVVILERGKKVEDRVNDVEKFFKEKILDENSNIQFGEGGAGTFSDGKLYSRIKSEYKSFFLETLVKCGAPEDILYSSHPHVGTDRLRKVLINFRKLLKDLGVEYRFSNLFFDFYLENNKIKIVYIKDLEKNKAYEEIFDKIILAIGHSSRDTYYLLYKKKINLNYKGFAIGVRIQHSQEYINKLFYKTYYKHPKLPPAEYNLTYSVGNRGVFTFCMCPGGVVLNATSELNSNLTNGMSNYLRETPYANSAVVTQIFEKDIYKFFAKKLQENKHFFEKILENIPQNSQFYQIYEELYKNVNYLLPQREIWALSLLFQKELEIKAFTSTKESYLLPAQRGTDFLKGIIRGHLPKTNTLPGVYETRLDEILPSFVLVPIKIALKAWSKKYKNFVSENTLVIGCETRTSSPVKILRNEKYQVLDKNNQAIRNLYAIGEGSGYAGGITSSAVDGIKAALKILED